MLSDTIAQILNTVAVAGLLWIGRSLLALVRSLNRMELQLGKRNEPPGLLWEVAANEVTLRDTRERVVKLETQQAERRSGRPE